MKDIYIYLTHKDGVLDDSALELISAAKKIDGSAKISAVVVGASDEVLNEAVKSYKEVIKIDGDAFKYPNAEIVRKALVDIIPKDSIVLMTYNTFAMDLAPGFSIKMDASYAADVVDFESVEGDTIKVVRQEFGGAVYSRSKLDISKGAVISVRGGVFPADESKSESGSVVDKSNDVKDTAANRNFIEIVAAEAGDVDITQSEILVSIGRGIEEEDNIEEAKELAETMGGDLACSRPIVDAKWLDKSRQVGTSGQTVKPKVYLALGISGSFQHLGGIKGNPFIVAVNKNPKAPIFQAADVGIVADILDFIPVLNEKIGDAK